MEKEETAEEKFVRALFSIVAWMMRILPMLYAIYVHEWLWLVLVIVVAIGAAVGTAIKKV